MWSYRLQISSMRGNKGWLRELLERMSAGFVVDERRVLEEMRLRALAPVLALARLTGPQTWVTKDTDRGLGSHRGCGFAPLSEESECLRTTACAT